MDGDVVAENLVADPVVQETAAVADRGAAEIHEHLAREIQHGGGFQDHRVASGGQFARVVRPGRLARRRLRERDRVQGA